MLSARASTSTCAVLVVDLQKSFHNYVLNFYPMVDRIRLLLAAGMRLDVPIAYTEQYPEGLGPTAASVLELLPDDTPHFGKVEFSALRAPGWAGLPPAVRDAQQVVLVGIEAHVCVRHTALDLLADGRDVFVPVDGVGSHTDLHRETSVRELVRAGAHETTIDQVVFDWLGAAGTPEFKDVQRLLKDRADS
jgi:nicotinamidase-related amidase